MAQVTQAQQVKRVAVYGGAFDPPTNSHMTCASEIVPRPGEKPPKTRELNGTMDSKVGQVQIV